MTLISTTAALIPLSWAPLSWEFGPPGSISASLAVFASLLLALMTFRRRSNALAIQVATLTLQRDAADVEANEVMARLDAVIEERKHDEARIRQLAYYDNLTGLPNRHHLLQCLAGQMDEGRSAGGFGYLIFLDLDNFKRINDVLGHQSGDLFLRDVAERLQEVVCEGELLARLGGDEFVLLSAPGYASVAEAQCAGLHQAECLRRALRPSVRQPSNAYLTTGSAGVTVFPREGQSGFDALREADTAMYRAKAAGRDREVCFETGMQLEIREQLDLERDLQTAIGNGELELHIQGQFAPNGTQIGAEALLRWNHPTRGLIPPTRFIPVAEASALIVPIGLWAIEQVAQVLLDLQKTGALIPVSVNVSVRQFLDGGFVDAVLDILETYQPPAGYLRLEVTESLLVNPFEPVRMQMNELIAAGIRFSVDDFGTGYSSLAYLKALPVQEIKIDQSFVRAIQGSSDQSAIILAILAMASSLGLDVVAEGVETADQRAFLVKAGCTRMQGFLFAHPMPVKIWRAVSEQPRCLQAS